MPPLQERAGQGKAWLHRDERMQTTISKMRRVINRKRPDRV